MEKISFITKSSKETERVGKIFASELKGGEVLSLIGDLGGGKTTFTQGLARGLKIKYSIVSPTFVIFKKYPVKHRKIKNLYHFDLYRISDPQELIDLDFINTISDAAGVTVIEWAQRAKNLIPAAKNIKITFKYIDKNKRLITFSTTK